MIHPSLVRLMLQTRIAPRLLLRNNNVYATSQLIRAYSEKPEQPNLPMMPVPKLADTMERFLNTCKPLLTSEEFKETMRVSQAFAGKDGQACKLQCMLQERARTTENWLADWWITAAYLSYRNSLIGWSSPGTPFATTQFECEEDFLCYAADVVLGALEFKKKIDDGNLKQEMMGKACLDMQQYKKVFGTCRIPGEKVDCMQYNMDSCHIVVVSNNHYYKIEVYDDEGCPISRKQLLKQLDALVLHSKSCTSEPIGILTATGRDTWHKNYVELSKNKCNQACLKYIQKSLFLLCLDRKIPNDCDYNDLTMAGLQTIHGGGSKFNAGNRWFDKCIQFVVSCDGRNGITYEHSPAEGGPVTTMGDFIQDYIKNGKGEETKDADLKDPVPRILKFSVNEAMCKAIDDAKKEVDKFVDDFDLSVFKFEEYGKEFIKEQKLSPDSYIQMAMQFAYYRLHNEPAAHYESASLRQFLHGRTETIRSCSCASVAFAKAMLNEDCDACDKVDSLKKAIKAHKEYTMAAINGCGIDRHLLGLKLQAVEGNMKPHDFYKDKGYIKSSTFLLSTSQVPTKHEGFMGYGPSDKDGYGICYNPRKDDIIISVASLKHSKRTSTEDMVEMLKCSLKDMMKVLCKCQKSNL